MPATTSIAKITTTSKKYCKKFNAYALYIYKNIGKIVNYKIGHPNCVKNMI